MKSRNLTFFTVANPGMPRWLDGDKWSILKKIPDSYLPQTVFIPLWTDIEQVLVRQEEKSLHYPLIVKPNNGARGRWVKKITHEQALRTYHQCIWEDYLLQEFIDFPIELGVFYIRKPWADQGEIVGVSYKEFQYIIWDGQKTFVELLEEGERTARFLDNYRWEHQQIRNKVIPAWEKIQVSVRGNHAQGAQCFDKSEYISPVNSRIFDDISEQIWGIYYGRYDIKCSSFEDFQQGKNIKIIEFNGIIAEPLHIYDYRYGPFQGYRKWLRYTKSLWEISNVNISRGYKSLTMKEFLAWIQTQAKNLKV